MRYLPGRSAPRLIASSRTRMSTGNAVDAALVARIAAGDRIAMRVLYVRHHARIRRFILRFADEAVADDLLHEAFLRVWRNAGRFAGGGPVSTWLLCVARQTTIQAALAARAPAAGPAANGADHA
jgi:DNA-directed RNA polymerase specialized sigma24 family protein